MRMGTYEDLLANSSAFTQLLKNIDQHERDQDMQRRQSIQNDPISNQGEEEKPLILSEHHEAHEKGSVKLRVYLDYLRAGLGGLSVSIFILLTFIVYQISSMSFSWWLAKWSEKEGHRHAALTNCTKPMTAEIEQIRTMTETEWNHQRDRTYYTVCGRFAFHLSLHCTALLIR